MESRARSQIRPSALMLSGHVYYTDCYWVLQANIHRPKLCNMLYFLEIPGALCYTDITTVSVNKGRRRRIWQPMKASRIGVIIMRQERERESHVRRPRKKSKAPLIVGLILAIFVLAAVIALIWIEANLSLIHI